MKPTPPKNATEVINDTCAILQQRRFETGPARNIVPVKILATGMAFQKIFDYFVLHVTLVCGCLPSTSPWYAHQTQDFQLKKQQKTSGGQAPPRPTGGA